MDEYTYVYIYIYETYIDMENMDDMDEGWWI